MAREVIAPSRRTKFTSKATRRIIWRKFNCRSKLL